MQRLRGFPIALFGAVALVASVLLSVRSTVEAVIDRSEIPVATPSPSPSPTDIVEEVAWTEAGKVKATAYCLKGRTATGEKVQAGLIAADPRIFPLGTILNITSGKYSGVYRVADTGRLIKGRKIDIWVPSCTEARRFGIQTISISLQSPVDVD